jgi:uncharacterized protein YybS (DUF2232 family)
VPPAAGAAGRSGMLTDAAVSVSLALLLFAAVQFLSVLGMPMALFAPAPLAVLCVRRGEPVFLACALLGLAAAGLAWGVGGAGAFLLAVAAPAFLIARGLTRGWAPEWVVGAAAALLTGATLGALTATLPDGIGPWVAGLVSQSIDLYAQQGAPEPWVTALKEQREQLTAFFHHMLPMGLAWSGMALATASLLAARAFFVRHPHPAATPFAPLTWHLRDEWVWALIAAGALLLVPYPPARIAGGNALGVLALAYAFQGWAVVGYIFEAKAVHRAVRIVFYLLLLLWPMLSLFLVLVGVLDIWTDLRKVRPRPDAAAG